MQYPPLDEMAALGAIEVEDYEGAVEQIYRLGWTDGLPFILPIPPLVQRVIDYLGRDPQEVLGVIPPYQGVASVEKVAVNCVMAGCLPEYVPVVLAALSAMLNERFNLNGVQATTHSAAPLIIISPHFSQRFFRAAECIRTAMSPSDWLSAAAAHREVWVGFRNIDV